MSSLTKRLMKFCREPAAAAAPLKPSALKSCGNMRDAITMAEIAQRLYEAIRARPKLKMKPSLII